MNNSFNKKPFTSIHKQAFNTLQSLTGVTHSASNIMIRVNTMNQPLDENADIPGREFFDDDIDTFVITTSADPENTIYYTSPVNVINMNVSDGGFF
jgi:hypothetical protein